MRKAYLILSTIITLASVGFGFWQFSLTKQATLQVEGITEYLQMGLSTQQNRNQQVYYDIESAFKMYNKKRDSVIMKNTLVIKNQSETLLELTSQLIKDIRLAQLENNPKLRFYDFWKLKEFNTSEEINDIYEKYLRQVRIINAFRRQDEPIEIPTKEEFYKKWFSAPNTSIQISNILNLEAKITYNQGVAYNYLASRIVGCMNIFPRIKQIYFTYY
jgi:nitrogen regulatory protein PII-like uncharacterized protein